MKVFMNGKVLLPEGILKKTNICIENGVIKDIRDEIFEDDELIDAEGAIISPGFVDIHVHGAGGSDFSDGSLKDIDVISEYLLKQGVTAFLGTTMSLSEELLSAVVEVAAPVTGITRPGKAVLWGINMEGPFIAMSKKGGQNGAYIRNSDYEMFLSLYKKSGNSIKLVDLAPELDGSIEFIRKAKELTRISLAHTDADYDMAKKAFQAGASHMTHLFNAMSPINHRNPGVILAAAEDAEFVEIICDGNHLHPAVIRFVFRLFGKKRVCIVSDSMRACGLSDGEYELGGQIVHVHGDKATLMDGTLAGSTTSIAEGMRRAVSFGVPVEEALLAATYVPAKAAGLDHILGSIRPGNRADLILLDDHLNVQSILLNGEIQQFS